MRMKETQLKRKPASGLQIESIFAMWCRRPIGNGVTRSRNRGEFLTACDATSAQVVAILSWRVHVVDLAISFSRAGAQYCRGTIIGLRRSKHRGSAICRAHRTDTKGALLVARVAQDPGPMMPISRREYRCDQSKENLSRAHLPYTSRWLRARRCRWSGEGLRYGVVRHG